MKQRLIVGPKAYETLARLYGKKVSEAFVAARKVDAERKRDWLAYLHERDNQRGAR